MKTNTLYTFKSCVLLIVMLCISLFSYTQTNPDSIDLHYPIRNAIDPTVDQEQSFDLGDPSSVQKKIEYDPTTGKYIFTEELNGMDYKRPSMMTLDQYIDYQREKKRSDYWAEKVETQNKKDQGLIPPIKIDSPLFTSIFGSDEIQIRPQGSIQISLGVNSSRYDNPSIPEKDRRITRFDFQQQIQLNLVGQIGTKLKLSASYNTEASFSFDNITKLTWTGDEDQILQEISAGNVSLPLKTSLIQGSQTLFGVRAKLKFGRLTVDAIASTSKGQKKEIKIKGGAQVKDFKLKADEYEANRHYFLNYYFREHYNSAMKTMPRISSLVNITRIEVWVTNQNSEIEDTRNIIAFTDLGESKPVHWSGNPGNPSSSELPDNNSNGLYQFISNNPMIRGFNNSVQALESQTTSPGPFRQSKEFEKIENARRLSDQEFTFNGQLGFINLNMPLNNDEVLGVAYEYTYQGRTYQVGDFSTDGVTGTDALFLKLLKPTITNPNNKLWDLMMKNVYSIGAYQVSQDGFRLNVLYNNPQNSLLINFLPYPGVDDKQVIELIGMDRLNQNNRAQMDGVFDFMPINIAGNEIVRSGTINTRNGRIFFSTIEPFGATIKKALVNNGLAAISNQVAFTELYDSTKIAARQIPKKNRFYFVGKYESSISDEIPLNALNVPEGSVVVTANGIRLEEGVDYTVDYNLGRVKILNSAILESNADIKISIESNSVFGFQNKSLMGTHLNYMINPDFNIGATWLRKSEKPVTQKVDVGQEPYSNNVVGIDLSYKTDIPFLTKLINFIPTISTKQMSTLTLNAEAAHLIPGTPRAIGKNGISYVDDFEGSQSSINLKSYSAWHLASIPQGQTNLFPEASLNGLGAGYNRAHLSWYVIDYSTFQRNTSTTPPNIANNPAETENMNVAYVNKTDLFPNNDPALGEITNITTFDLTYYPKERGMYNYDNSNTVDANGRFIDPQNRWGGIMRALSTTDFERTNVQYIQFWLLDPFNTDQEAENPNTAYTGGELYFNLGNISEDILPDSRKSFENGLPREYSNTVNIDYTKWARVSTKQNVVNAFDNDPEARAAQDVGLDGYNDDRETEAYKNYVNWIKNNATLTQTAKDSMLADISNDNYIYYRDDRYDAQKKGIIERYKHWNGMEGNSPTPEMSEKINKEGYTTQSTNRPDIEDINNDNNLSETESYFQYKVSLHQSDLKVGKNYIINTREYTKGSKKYKWYQFRIPVRSPQKAVNGISDFRSIRFMRIFMRGFSERSTLRFAKLELIRSDWRKFEQSLQAPGDGVQTDPNLTQFSIGAVNIEQYDQREPINYVIPPGIQREIDPSQQFQRQLNEQSMTLEVCGLKDGDARAGTKNMGIDLLKYKHLEMFIHGEMQDKTKPVKDYDVTVFVRLGTDFKYNYYEYEVPIKMTQWGATSKEDIWPGENNMRVVFDELIKLKKKRNKQMEDPNSGVSYNVEYTKAVNHQSGESDIGDIDHPKRVIKVKGNPNLTDVKTIMIGVRNPSQNADNPWKPDDGMSKCVEIWVDELRLTGFHDEGGSAALAQANLQIADFANIKVATSYSGLNWGDIDSRVSERQKNQKFDLDITANAQLGQLFGRKARLSIPFLFTYSLGTVTPEYDPYNPDIKLSSYAKKERKKRKKAGQQFNQSKSYNFNNVRLKRKPGAESHFWSLSNFSLNYGYSEELHRNFRTKYDKTRIWKGGINYVYNASPTLWQPFKDVKFMKHSEWWNLIRQFNLYLGPKNISVKNNLIRTYNERQIKNNIPNTNFEFRPIYLKKFVWNKSFNFQYDLTRNLKFDFTTNNHSIFDEPKGQIDKEEAPDNYREFKDSIRTQMRTLGKTMRYNQNYNITYNIPFNKIPVLNFINSNVRYSGSYEWSRPNLGMEAFGNTIQNSREINGTAQLNMITLYKKSKFFKRVLSGGGRSLRRSLSQLNRGPSSGNSENDSPLAKKVRRLRKEKEKLEKADTTKMSTEEFEDYIQKGDKIQKKLDKKEPRLEAQNKRIEDRKQQREENKEKYGTPYHPVVGFLARMLMSVRTISGTYSQTDGMLLPGFNQEAHFFGMNETMFSDPKILGFAFGKQQRNVFGQKNGFHLAPYAGSRGYIVDTSGLNAQHTIMHSQNYSLRASIEPIKDLQIDLTMSRNFTQNTSEFYRFSDSLQAFTEQSKFLRTTVTYSTISIGSAFQTLDKNYRSQSFDKLRNRRSEISAILGKNNPHSSLDSAGYYDGYGPNQQNVIVGAFLTTYSGKSANKKSIRPLRNIPLPNWNISYNGLSKLDFFKGFIQNFTLRHGYRSSVTVAGMQTNLNAKTDANGNLTARNHINNNFIAEQQIQNITVTERFSPLIGFDATWKVGENGLLTKFEYSKERTATLALTNNQITVMKGTEFVIGAGYKFSNFVLPISFGKRKLKPSDLNIRVDLSIRDNLTVIRKVVENTTQATAGQKIFSLQGTIDYLITKNLTVSLYYNQQLNTPKVATSYKTGNIAAGLRLRFNLGGL